MTTDLEIGAAYIRVSTDDQTELSPDAQLRVILDAAKEDGYVIPKEYIFVEKKGISGRKANNRPEFQRMIAMAKSQAPAPFRRLYLWKFSRFARNQEESTFYKGILRKKCGVEIKSVSEPIADGMFGRLIETIIEWFDEYYSYNLSGEVIRGMSEKALRHGYQMVPCLGYDAVGGGKPYVINEEKYKIVEYIFRSYHDGMDMSGISRECNKRGWLTRRNHPFERRTVFRILKNPFYVGVVEWNGYRFQGTHEVRSSITDIFEDCQQRIAREYKPTGRHDVSACRHWLSGLMRCSVCGATLAYSHIKKSNSGVFNCWKYLKGFHPISHSIMEKDAIAAVYDSFKQIIDTGVVEFEVTPPKNDLKEPEERLLKSALDRLDIKEMRIHEAYEAGIDTLEEYKNNKLRLAQERERLLNEYQELQEIHLAEIPSVSTEEMVDRIRNVYDIITDPELGRDVKGVAIRSVLKEIIWNREKREFTFHYYV